MTQEKRHAPRYYHNVPNDFDLAIQKIKQARLATAASLTGEPLISIGAAVKASSFGKYQLYRHIQSGRLKAFPVGGALGEMTGRYLIRLSDVEKLQPALRGPIPKSI